MTEEYRGVVASPWWQRAGGGATIARRRPLRTPIAGAARSAGQGKGWQSPRRGVPTTTVAREEAVGGRSATRPAIRACSRAPSDDDGDLDDDDACACLSIKIVGPPQAVAGGCLPCRYVAGTFLVGCCCSFVGEPVTAAPLSIDALYSCPTQNLAHDPQLSKMSADQHPPLTLENREREALRPF